MMTIKRVEWVRLKPNVNDIDYDELGPENESSEKMIPRKKIVKNNRAAVVN